MNYAMNPAKTYAGVFGAVYLLVGLVGFAVTGTSQSTYHLLGIFDINALHNVVHIVIGVAGLAAFAMGVASSRMYCIGIAVILIVVAAAGFAPQQFLGIVPLGGIDIGLHGATALVALLAYFMSAPSRTTATSH